MMCRVMSASIEGLVDESVKGFERIMFVFGATV